MRIAGVDLLDDTPLLDIKPYVSQYDNYPGQRTGWIEKASKGLVFADGRFEK